MLDNKVTRLTLSNTPNGYEVEFEWELQRDLNSDEKLFVFKRSGSAPTKEEIQKYIEKPSGDTITKGLFVFHTLNVEMRGFKDVIVEAGKTYFYTALIVKYPKGLDNKIQISEDTTKSIVVTEFQGKANVVDTKKHVSDAIKQQITSKILREAKLKLDVYNDFPIENVPTAFFVVTRGTNENAYTFWSNISSAHAGEIVQGNVDTDVIVVTWETQANPTLRDDLTDIVRAAQLSLVNYLRNANPQILDVKTIMQGDGQDQRIQGTHLVYGQMLVHCLIMNTITTTTENAAKKINTEFEFSSAE